MDDQETRTRLEALAEAQMYLAHDWPEQALRVLDRVDGWGPHQGQAMFLRGEALRSLAEYEQAAVPLEIAVAQMNEFIPARVALAWCCKRTDRLADAIQVLDELSAHAARVKEPIIPFNLACYHSLAGHRDKALAYLQSAAEMDAEYVRGASSDADLDPIRDDPEFQRLVGDSKGDG